MYYKLNIYLLLIHFKNYIEVILLKNSKKVCSMIYL